MNSYSPQSHGTFRGRDGTNISHRANDVWGCEQSLTTADSLMFCRQLSLRGRKDGGGWGGGTYVDTILSDINKR